MSRGAFAGPYGPLIIDKADHYKRRLKEITDYWETNGPSLDKLYQLCTDLEEMRARMGVEMGENQQPTVNHAEQKLKIIQIVNGFVEVKANQLEALAVSELVVYHLEIYDPRFVKPLIRQECNKAKATLKVVSRFLLQP